MNVSSIVNLVDCRTGDWRPKVSLEIETCKNFVAITGQSSVTFDELSQFLRSPSYLPASLERWGIHALNDSLKVDDYKQLLKLFEAGEKIFLIEALRLHHHQPPRLKSYLVYCEARGIVSDHSTRDEAVHQLKKYFDGFHRARMFPLAGVYRWENSRWTPVPSLKAVTPEFEPSR